MIIDNHYPTFPTVSAGSSYATSERRIHVWDLIERDWTGILPSAQCPVLVTADKPVTMAGNLMGRPNRLVAFFSNPGGGFKTSQTETDPNISMDLSAGVGTSTLGPWSITGPSLGTESQNITIPTLRWVPKSLTPGTTLSVTTTLDCTANAGTNRLLDIRGSVRAVSDYSEPLQVDVSAPATVDFGSVVLGSNTNRELPLSVMSNATVNAEMSFRAPSTPGKPTQGQLDGFGYYRIKLPATLGGGYADVSGSTRYPLTLRSGETLLNTQMELIVPSNATAKEHSTNLSITVRQK